MSAEIESSDDRRPLDYERRRRGRASPGQRVRGLAVDVCSALPAFAVPVWACFVTWRLSDHAAKHATMPLADVALIVLTFAIPIGFALLACGPLARDDRPRRR